MNPEENKAQEPTTETTAADTAPQPTPEDLDAGDAVAQTQPEDGANAASGIPKNLHYDNPRYGEEAHHFRKAYLSLLQGLIIAGKNVVDATVHALAMRGAEMAVATFDAKYPKELPVVEGVGG